MKYVLAATASLLAIACLVITILTVFHYSGQNEQAKCQEYERSGVIPPHSCDCTMKLFPDWQQSYDWKDSCAILEARTK